MAARTNLRPRKLPTQERARVTVDAILEATTYILHKRGLEGLSTNRVAERAGVNIATLYQYFPNKESLLAELGRRHAHEARAAALAVLDEPGRGRGMAAMVRAMVDALLASHRVQPALHRILTLQAMQSGEGRVQTEADVPLERLGRMWLDASAERFEHPELTLWIAATAAHSVLHAALLEKPALLDHPAFADELARLVTRYLRA